LVEPLDLLPAVDEPHITSMSRCCDDRLKPPWLPASEWVTSPIRRLCPRERRAISNASSTIEVFMFDATRQPTIRRLNASTMKHTYAMPDRVGT
jgi:hypothetical protein